MCRLTRFDPRIPSAVEQLDQLAPPSPLLAKHFGATAYNDFAEVGSTARTAAFCRCGGMTIQDQFWPKSVLLSTCTMPGMP